MQKIISIFSLFLFITALQAQDLKGKWIGRFQVEEGVGQGNYIEIFIQDAYKTTDGSFFIRATSEAHLYIKNKKYTCRKLIQGNKEGNRLILRDMNYLSKEQDKRYFNWCLWDLNLEIKEYRIEGTWRTDNKRGCSSGELSPSGTIYFERDMGIYQKVQNCIARNIEAQKTKGKYEKTADFEQRIANFDKKMAREKHTQTCIESYKNEILKWEGTTNEYDADKEVFTIKIPNFMPFEMAVPIDEAQLFDKNFEQLKYDDVVIGIDEAAKQFTLKSLTFINPQNDKSYIIHEAKPEPDKTVILDKVEDRTVVQADKIVVNSDRVKVDIWDNQHPDGDIINIYLNGELILENIKVEKEKSSHQIQLKSGANQLVVHAVNLGRRPPNTAAVRIHYNGDKKKELILKSDMNESASLIIEVD